MLGCLLFLLLVLYWGVSVCLLTSQPNLHLMPKSLPLAQPRFPISRLGVPVACGHQLALWPSSPLIWPRMISLGLFTLFQHSWSSSRGLLWVPSPLFNFEFPPPDMFLSQNFISCFKYHLLRKAFSAQRGCTASHCILARHLSNLVIFLFIYLLSSSIAPLLWWKLIRETCMRVGACLSYRLIPSQHLLGNSKCSC